MHFAGLSKAKLAANLSQPLVSRLSQILRQGPAPELWGAMGLPVPPWGHILVVQMPIMLPKPAPAHFGAWWLIPGIPVCFCKVTHSTVAPSGRAQTFVRQDWFEYCQV